MTRETKFISFAAFKAKTEGPGGWEGYLSKTGEIDDGGDLIIQGAYADTIPDWLARGFNASSHEWDFAKAIGFPLDAKEDGQGLYVTCQFHGTPDAQLVRQKAQERMDAGKGVFMSIGYEAMPADIERIEPDKYAERIPELSRKGLSEQNLLKALQFPWIRLIRKVNLFEGSIVSVPMLRSAEVTAVKSLDSDGLHGGMTLEEQRRQALEFVVAYNDRLKAVVRLALETKVGAAISSARRERISGWGQTLRQMADEVDELYEETTPKPKEDEGKSFDIQQVINHLMVMDLQLQGVPIK